MRTGIRPAAQKEHTRITVLREKAVRILAIIRVIGAVTMLGRVIGAALTIRTELVSQLQGRVIDSEKLRQKGLRLRQRILRNTEKMKSAVSAIRIKINGQGKTISTRKTAIK